jgi:hypothetical protein
MPLLLVSLRDCVADRGSKNRIALLSPRECASFPQRAMPVREYFYVREIKAPVTRYMIVSGLIVSLGKQIYETPVISKFDNKIIEQARRFHPTRRTRLRTYAI